MHNAKKKISCKLEIPMFLCSVMMMERNIDTLKQERAKEQVTQKIQ